jgi:DNA-binding winged helix-turn-helix (wHTH) protein/predicted Zn-dependent protease
MAREILLPGILLFGIFEADLGAGELRKQGKRIKLQDQPFQVLAVLLQHPGRVVTREELRSQIWPEDTFVDFDNSLNTAINKLREALGDSANNPRFIETLPRRGYRFLPPVSSNDCAGLAAASSANVVSASTSSRWRIRALIVIAALVGLASGIFFWRPREAQRLTEKDTIVIADFTNTTGDPIFDDSLKQGLRVQLEQSPFLSVLSDQQADEQLKLMARSAGERLTPDLARDLCQRVGSKAVLNSTISSLGTHYVIGLNALNCHTGVELASEQVEADSREHVLKALGESATKMRHRLGESLATIQRYDTPIEQATTSSLEALQAYSLGQKTWQAKGAVASLAFFRRAVKLDPNFAMAYGRMGTAYGPAGENGLSIENIRKAYELRTKVSDRERLYVEAHYYDIATGEIEKAVQVYQLWEQIYPRDPAPHDNLADVYWSLGEPEKALDEALETMRLRPNGVSSYEDVSRSYLRLGRLDEAQTVLRNAEQRRLESGWLDRTRYEAAFLNGDQDEMRRLAGSKRSEALLLYLQGYTEAYYGRVRKARGLWRQSEKSFKDQDLIGFAAYVSASAALAEAVIGDSGHARTDSFAALQLRETPQTRDMAALALALAADYKSAENLAGKIRGNYRPIDPRFYLLTMRAASALGHRDATGAIEVLQGVSPYVGGDMEEMISVHLRGQAYLMLHDGSASAAEFRNILDHPGLVLENPVGALAHLGLGRSYVLQGNVAKARAAYQAFLTLWKDADPDIHVLMQAKAEYARLQ